MAFILLILFLSASLTVIIIPFVTVISRRSVIMNDTANEFRMQNNVLWLGGLPLLFTLFTVVIVGIKLSGELALTNSGMLFMVLLGGVLIFLVGLLYDSRLLSPRVSLCFI